MAFIKQLGLSIIFTLLLIIPISAQDALTEAQLAYERGDYATAITAYEAVISNGESNGEIFYNLGTMYYEIGDLGRAMHNYRRAALYLPRDPDVQVNIRRVRSERINIDRDEVDWLHLLAGISSDMLTSIEMAWLTFALWVAFFISVIIGIFLSFPINARIINGILGMLLLGAAIILGSRMYVYYEHPAAVIVPEEVSVMSGPGEDYQELYTLFAAAEIRVVERRDNDWVRFALPDGTQGWLNEADFGYVAPQLFEEEIDAG